ncbi:MAG: metallophosphoesterase [Bacteroidota bacterium]|nr:metallophosphoesterase [Bacteroidota bacterium]
MRLKLSVVVAVVLFVALTVCNDTPAKTDMASGIVTQGIIVNPDSVQFSFVFMGCNRVDGKDINDSNTNASTANVPELQRTFTEVSGLNPKPVFFFFLGDEVLGLTQKTKTLQDELKAWRKQYADTTFSPLPASGIQMIAIPGNHEMLYSGKDKKGNHVELPNSQAITVWIKEMNSFVPAKIPLNHVGGPDSLDNRMTYSFTYGNTHFILINTDTYDTAGVIGMAPAAWINADIIAARKDTAVKHIFLLGHKPAIVNKGLYEADGDDTMDTSVVKSIWPVMDSNKVEAILSAHSHQYNRKQPDSSKAYQVIAGNGGSPYEGAIQHKDSIARQFFGYTIVYIMKNNNVVVQSMGRTVKYKDYLETLKPGDSTTVRDLVNISWGTHAGDYSPAKQLKGQ